MQQKQNSEKKGNFKSPTNKALCFNQINIRYLDPRCSIILSFACLSFASVDFSTLKGNFQRCQANIIIIFSAIFVIQEVHYNR